MITSREVVARTLSEGIEDIRWYGSSNGYYGVSVECEFII